MKFCEKCGKQLEDDAVICTGCGCPTDKWKNAEESSNNDFSQYAMVKEKKPFPWSLVALILGIAGMVTSITGLLGVILGIAGIVLSNIGKKKAPEDTRFKIATRMSIVAIVIGGLVFIVPMVFPLLQMLVSVIIALIA